MEFAHLIGKLAIEWWPVLVFLVAVYVWDVVSPID